MSSRGSARTRRGLGLARPARPPGHAGPQHGARTPKRRIVWSIRIGKAGSSPPCRSHVRGWARSPSNSWPRRTRRGRGWNGSRPPARSDHRCPEIQAGPQLSVASAPLASGPRHEARAPSAHLPHVEAVGASAELSASPEPSVVTGATSPQYLSHPQLQLQAWIRPRPRTRPQPEIELRRTSPTAPSSPSPLAPPVTSTAKSAQAACASVSGMNSPSA